jgi:hypothetical protein
MVNSLILFVNYLLELSVYAFHNKQILVVVSVERGRKKILNFVY